MKNLVILLILGFLSACVAVNPIIKERPSVIPLKEQQILQAALKSAPPELYRRISKAAEQLPLPYYTNSTDRQDLADSKKLVFDILTRTSDQTLLPDKTFEKLNSVVTGTSSKLPHTYADALTSYLTESDFSCKQPLYSRYFNLRYAPDAKERECKDEVPFSVISRYNGAHTVWLKPSRVSSIHLLFANKSRSMASRFGHVALRFVICPEGNGMSESCDSNLREHLVLGFMAHIDDLALDTLKALRSEYRAYLFANDFMDVYEEYAIGEFRDVYSLPLNLNDVQRDHMVREMSDIHWRFSGDYSFFTKNCATLLQDALRVTWPEFAANNNVADNYLRPDSLFEAIRESSLADGKKLSSLDTAERDGYYFSNTKQFYDRAINEVRGAMEKPGFTDLDGYLDLHPVKRRLDRSIDERFTSNIATDRHLLEAQIMLEEYAVLHSERKLMSSLTNYLIQEDFLANSERILALLDAEHAKAFDDCLLTPIRQHAEPIRRVNGIPDRSQMPKLSAKTSLCKSPMNQKLLQEAIVNIDHTKSEQLKLANTLSEYLFESMNNLYLLNISSKPLAVKELQRN